MHSETGGGYKSGNSAPRGVVLVYCIFVIIELFKRRNISLHFVWFKSNGERATPAECWQHSCDLVSSDSVSAV
jgi:hypothetical protein